MPIGYAFLLGRETSCGCSCHGMTHGIKQPHAANFQECAFDGSQQYIDHKDIAGHDTCLGTNLAVGHSRCLRQIEHLTADTKPRQKYNGEADNSQAANPLRQTSPEQYSMGHAIDVVQYGGSSGGET